MDGIFKNKVALVTGAASGIGLATAMAFIREGAKVVLADVTVDAGESAARKVRENGGDAVFVRADVSNAAEVEALVRKTVDTYGRLDCAVNNAGIEGIFAPTADCTEENWDRVISINLKGCWLCMKHEIIQMLSQGGGSIVNISSIAGLVGFVNIPAYTASKHGMIGLTRTAALEYAKKNIRVNAVCPGVIRTAMVDRVIGGSAEVEAQYTAMEPVGRLGTPEEVAESILWLASDQSSFVTGTYLVVDGAMTAM